MLWLIKGLRLSSTRKNNTVLLCAQAKELKSNISNFFCVFQLIFRAIYINIHFFKHNKLTCSEFQKGLKNTKNSKDRLFITG